MTYVWCFAFGVSAGANPDHHTRAFYCSAYAGPKIFKPFIMSCYIAPAAGC